METGAIRNVAVVSTEILGNASWTATALEGLKALGLTASPLITLRPEDFREHPVPGWRSHSDVEGALWQFGRKAAALTASPVEALLANGWEVPIALARLGVRVPTIAAMDTTPAALLSIEATHASASPAARGRKLSRRAILRFHSWRFRRAVRNVVAFLPRTSWCGASLSSAYGVDPEHWRATLGPLNLDVWHPAEPPRTLERLRLLFVGNLFELKGGPFLLQLYTEHLRDVASLTIISTDPAVRNLPSIEGVRVIPGIPRSDMPARMREADLFVFPTRRDMMGFVVAEALASGLPVLASPSGGLPDLVLHDQTGYLLPPDDPVPWVTAIRSLNRDRDRLHRLARGARAFAEKRLSLEAFQATLAWSLELARRAGVAGQDGPRNPGRTLPAEGSESLMVPPSQPAGSD